MHIETSNYTLELPNFPNTYLIYHASELKTFIPNDPILFHNHKHVQLRPIITNNGLEEFLVQEILNYCC
jgi:hypothetical protein